MIINSHWLELDDKIRVATNSNPTTDLTPLVPREYYDHFIPNVSRDLGLRVIALLKENGFADVDESTDAEWVDAPLTPSLHMFPKGTPMLPATMISINARCDPVLHVKMGQALRSLRKAGILLIGSGAVVHNIFRGTYITTILQRDNLQKYTKPDKFAADFEKTVDNVITSNSV